MLTLKKETNYNVQTPGTCQKHLPSMQMKVFHQSFENPKVLKTARNAKHEASGSLPEGLCRQVFDAKLDYLTT